MASVRGSGSLVLLDGKYLEESDYDQTVGETPPFLF